MWKASLKGIAARKRRLLLTSIAIVLGVAFMAGTLVLSDTITRTFDALAVNVNAGLSAQVRAKASFDDPNGHEQRDNISAGLLRVVRRVPGVSDARPSVQGFAVIVSKAGKGLDTSGQGPPPLAFAWDSNPTLNPMRLVAGTAPRAPDEIVIDKRSADRTHFKIGDRIRVVTVSGRGTSNLYRLAGIGTFGSASSPAGASLVFFTPDVAEQLLTAPGKINAIQITAASGVSEATLVRRVQGALRGQPGVEVVSGAAVVQEQQNNFQTNFNFFTVFLLVFAIIALIVGSFVIYNTFSITVAQRTRENALMRAIGVSRLQVTTGVLLEATATAIVASLLGLGLGIVMAGGLKALLAALGIDIPAGGTVVKSGTVVVSLVVGIVVTLVAAVLPALRASRVRPLAALRDVAVDRARTSVGRIIAGALVTLLGAASLFAGLFGHASNAGLQVATGALIIFVGATILGPILARPAARIIGAPLPKLRGITGQLARENAMRNPKRMSSTAAALMIGVGLVGFVTIFAASAKASIAHIINSEMKADYIVNTSGSSTLPPAIETRVGRVAGVTVASGLRIGTMKVEGTVETVEALDPAVVDQLFDVGIAKGRLADLGNDGVAVYKGVATSKHLAIGSRLDVQYPKTGNRVATVRAIYNEQALAGPYVISLANYEHNFTDQTDTVVMIKTAPGKAASARAGIEAVLARYPNGTLQNQAQFKASRGKEIDQILNLIYALLLMAIIIAVFGIGNALALSIFERTREIGLLRAVGSGRPQVRAIVRWEAVIIALFGTLLGLTISVFFGWVLVRALASQGISRLSLPAGQLLILVLLGAIVGILAAWLPARRAARLDILQAIATD